MGIHQVPEDCGQCCDDAFVSGCREYIERFSTLCKVKEIQIVRIQSDTIARGQNRYLSFLILNSSNVSFVASKNLVKVVNVFNEDIGVVS